MLPDGIDLSGSLLAIESAILGAYVLYGLANIWSLRKDPASLLPKSRAALVMLHVLVVLMVAFLLYSWNFEHILLAVDLAVGFSLMVFHPATALGFFIVLLFLRPWELLFPPNEVLLFVPRLAGILTFASVAFYTLRNRRLELNLPVGLSLAAAFSFWVFLSTFQSPVPADARSEFFGAFLKSIALFFVALQALNSERSLRIAQGSLICGGLGVASVALAKTFLIGAGAGGRLTSFGLLADPNDISAVMMIIVPFSLFQGLRPRESMLSRAIAGFSILLTILLLILAKSRGALLSALVMVAVVMLLRSRRKGIAMAVAGVALALFVPISASFNRSASDLSESSESRLEYWKTATRMALHHPFFGVGFGGYPLRFEQYTSQFIEFGNRTAHSSWFLVLGETGWVGLVLFLVFYGYAVRAAWSIREERPEYIVSLLGYGTAMSFLSHSYMIYPYLLVALTLVAARLSRERLVQGGVT
jgi:putative inorganic carbon (hco3(-)) transporter